jgi:predicted transposase/invertase (TIGR01784 family)
MLTIILLHQLNIAHLDGYFCAPLCRKSSPNLRVRLRFASRGTQNYLVNPAQHYRADAARRAGLFEVPCRVVNADDDTAVMIITDTNLRRREKLAISDKARAYAMQLEALRHQGKRSDLLNMIQNDDSGIRRGISYRDMMRSYQITFCGFTVFPGREGAVTSFSFRSEDGEEFSDAVSIVFVELPKFSGVMKKPVSEMSSLEMWGIFFGQANKPECGEILRQMVLRKEEIKVASELLTSISKDEIERAHYRSRRMFRMDMEHSMAVAREEGKLEMARSLLKSGVPADVIAGASGLSTEEILKLSN